MDKCTSKKRKMSFANDRLKRLRTSINNDVSSSLSPNTSNKLSLPNSPKKFQERKNQIINNDVSSNTVFTTPSVKSSVPNNPKGFQERKKLIPARKLKNNSSRSNPININNQNQQISAESNIDESELFGSTPKRRKVDVTKSNTNSSIKLGDTPIPQKNNSGLLNNSPIKCKRNLTTNSSILDLNQTPKKLPEYIKNTNEKSANSQQAKVRNNSVTNFPDISSKKTKFEYQHTSNVTTQQVNTKSSIKNTCSSVNIGQALSSLFNKLFHSQNYSDNNGVEHGEDIDSMDWEPNEEFESNVLDNQEEKSKQTIYIIVDTNIFLDSLNFLREITNIESQGLKPVIYVPWMVFNELDYIKDNKLSGLKSAASRAIDFINKMLTIKEEKLIGQSIFEANKQMYVGKSPDDKIASCCLQVKEKGYNVILLSNDKNLRNKMIINNIPSFSCDGILTNLEDIPPFHAAEPPKNDKIGTLMYIMKKCCENIITDCCEKEYGDIWNKLALLDTQPWDFHMCLKIFQKYWSAVFRDRLLKQFINIVERMLTVMKKSGSLNNATTFKNFAEDCLSLCFFLMDLEQFKDLVQETTEEVNSLIV